MTSTAIDAAELRLLSNIIALVLDDQPGQAGAALETLRRRAAAHRVTGGALKNLFDRLATEANAGPAAPPRTVSRQDIHRLQQDLDAALVQGSRLAAENGALHQRLAEAERRLRFLATLEASSQRSRSPTAASTLRMPDPPARHRGGVLVGMLLGLLAVAMTHDHGPGPPPNRHAVPLPHRSAP